VTQTEPVLARYERAALHPLVQQLHGEEREAAGASGDPLGGRRVELQNLFYDPELVAL
jgi:hypothetical protein